jgi:hypothetical protein
MSVVLQEVVAFVLVLAAAGYATWSLWLRRRWRARQARAAAAAGLPVPATGGGCSSCESAPPDVRAR